jgi:hypothetical protein
MERTQRINVLTKPKGNNSTEVLKMISKPSCLVVITHEMIKIVPAMSLYHISTHSMNLN